MFPRGAPLLAAVARSDVKLGRATDEPLADGIGKFMEHTHNCGCRSARGGLEFSSL